MQCDRNTISTMSKVPRISDLFTASLDVTYVVQDQRTFNNHEIMSAQKKGLSGSSAVDPIRLGNGDLAAAPSTSVSTKLRSSPFSLLRQKISDLSM